MDIKLYQNKLSPNSKRVRVIAREVGANLELVEVDFAKGENRTPEYLAKNPMGKVPTIETANGSFWESPACLVRIAAEHKSSLLPLDPVNLSETFRWMFWNASHLEAALFAVLSERFFAPMFGRTPNQDRIDSALKDVARYAPILDQQVASSAWLLGNTFTIADIAIATTWEVGLMVAKDELAAYGNIRSWFSRVSERPSWKD